MLVCDKCGKKKDVNGPGALFNMMQLRWVSPLKPDQMALTEFHLCNDCTKEVAALIKRFCEEGKDAV